jgi:hypothetical protein
MTYRPLPSTVAHWDRLRGTLSYELPMSPHTGVDAALPTPHWCQPRSAPKGRFSCQPAVPARLLATRKPECASAFLEYSTLFSRQVYYN